MNTDPTPSQGPRRFDHEKLDVYRVELEFVTWVTPLLEEVKTAAGSRTAEVRAEGKELLLRVVSMLCKLIDRYSPPEGLHEETIEYGRGDSGGLE